MCTVSVLSCVCQIFIKEFHDDDDNLLQLHSSDDNTVVSLKLWP